MSPRLNIVADAHIWGVQSAFSNIPGFDVNLRTFEAADIDNSLLQDAEVLITRSTTKVNADLLNGTPVRFAATATIGDDHYDKAYLQTHRIAYANAAGSSTGSVIEYMLTVFLTLHARGLICLPETRLGIIGAGRIGGGLADICRKSGIDFLLNDPPRARIEGGNEFSPLETLLKHADILSLHTPLNRSGEDCSAHLLDAETLSRFKGRGIINAGRGACLDNNALIHWLNGNSDRFSVLDCWENEPAISAALLTHPQVIIATPHIAGHSLDGKAANTQFAYNALCSWLGIAPVWQKKQDLPPDDAPFQLHCNADAWTNLHMAATHLYPIANDDAALRKAAPSKQRITETFADYRRHYPIRRAWSHAPLQLNTTDNATLRLARAIGMKIV